MQRVPAELHLIPIEIADESHRYVLRQPIAAEAEWNAYHDLRRTILFERRGRLGVYDASHADEHAAGNYPFLFWFDGQPAGTIRIDITGTDAIFRLVTIREDHQRRGLGRRMLALAERFARSKQRTLVHSHVNRAAIGFYERCGFLREGPDNVGDTVLMVKTLSSEA
jgi:GNAT superfamily N-acetyltransferase